MFTYYCLHYFLNMKIIPWNVQGISNKFTKQQSQNLLKTQNVDFIFCCDIKIDENRMDLVSHSVHYQNLLALIKYVMQMV